MRTATIFVVISTTIHLLAYLLPQAMPEHLVEMNWPAHARFHMWQATFWLISLDVMILIVALVPFRQKQDWTFWALLAGFAGSQLGYFLASALVPEGRPDTQGADIGLLFVMLIYLAGLVLGWREMRKP